MSPALILGVVMLVILYLLLFHTGSERPSRKREGLGLGSSNPYLASGLRPEPADESEDTCSPEDNERQLDPDVLRILAENPYRPTSSQGSYPLTTSGSHPFRTFVRWAFGAVVTVWLASHVQAMISTYVAQKARGGTYNPSQGFLSVLFEAIFGVIWAIIVFILWFLLSIPALIWNAIFSSPGGGNKFVFGCFAFWVLTEIVSPLSFAKTSRAFSGFGGKISSGASSVWNSFESFFVTILAFVLPTPKKFHSTKRKGLLMGDHSDDFYKEASAFRDAHPELKLSPVPVPISEHRTWLESVNARIQMQRYGKEMESFKRALDARIEVIARLVQLEEMQDKGEKAALSRKQTAVDAEMIEQEKRVKIAKLRADEEEHNLRREQILKQKENLNSPLPKQEVDPLVQAKYDLELAKTKDEIDKILNPPEHKKPDVAAASARKLEAIAVIEKKMNEMLAKAKTDEQRDRIRTIFRAEINRIKEGG